MRRPLFACLVALAVVSSVLAAPAPVGPEYAEGEALVKFRPRVDRGRVESLLARMEAEPAREFGELSRRDGRVWLLVRSKTEGTAALLARLAADPGVEAVSPNWRRRLFRTPNDTRWPKLWGLARISAEPAWDLSTGSENAVVAVLDTGIDYTHPDLSGNLWRNPNEIPGNGVDDDGNGYVDDVYGCDFAANYSGGDDGDPMDNSGHGTHVAGTIAAVGDNGRGVAGICWTARLMALKVARPGDDIYDADVIQAIDYAVKMKTQYGVPIVALNASFGGTGYNSLERDAIAAAGQAGMAFVAAAGNGGDDDTGDDNDLTPQYPASYDGESVVAVAASDANDALAGFSNYGASSVDLAAPGVSILSTMPVGLGQESSVTQGANGYDAIPMTYAGLTSAAGITQALVSCGQGLAAGDFPAAVNGNIALIERGTNTFADKTRLAMTAGAVAVVVFNNAEGNFSGTLGGLGSWVPVVSLARADGLALRALGTPTVTLVNGPSDYEYKDGTSMAAPHVSGAIGLLASLHPADSLSQRLGRLYSGVDKLDGLAGKVRTGGRLNLHQALRQVLSLSLQGTRSLRRAWLIRKDYAALTLKVEKFQPLGNESYRLYRRSGGGDWSLVHTWTATDIAGGSANWNDPALAAGTTYSYYAAAVDSAGGILARSSEVAL